MNLLFIAVNTQYIHTNPAVRILRQRLIQRFPQSSGQVQIAEFTINQWDDDILGAIYRLHPKALGFSCYLWNIDIVRRLCTEYRKIDPSAVIFLGGPEVSYDAQAELGRLPAADFILCGEGEYTIENIYPFLSQWKPALEAVSRIPGIVYRNGGKICTNPPGEPVKMEDVPFPYSEKELKSGRILYYETIRGCPFQCQYCLSSAEKGVRFRPLEQVFRDFDCFLGAKVRQVKLVDRTFNCSKPHAIAIWKYLSEHDNGITNFHFELAVELLDEETLDFLSKVRPGLFQFEIGVQSANPETLQAIRRPADMEHIRYVTQRIHSGGNIHQHLDLIAGLPYEGFASFADSFRQVYEMKPHQLQLGFLKLLKGTGLYRDADTYGIVCRDTAPYEVLKTRWLSYRELLELKDIEAMVETYYNSGRFRFSVLELEKHFHSPFAFYQSLAAYWRETGAFEQNHRNEQVYELLWLFFRDSLSPSNGELEGFKWLLKHDLCLHQKPKRSEERIAVSLYSAYRNKVSAFYHSQEQCEQLLPSYVGLDPHQVARITHMEVYPFDPRSGLPSCWKQDRAAGMMLYDYQNREWNGMASHHWLPFAKEQDSHT